VILVSTLFGTPTGGVALEPVTPARRSSRVLASEEYGVAELSAHPSPGQPAVVRGVRHSLVLPADIVRPIMAGQRPPSEPRKDDPPPADLGQGMVAISYLLGGMIVWGGVGWLVDHYWTGTTGIATGIGAVVGGAAGVYLIVRRLGA
jgi:F0F1-type ATP synthase assembly protein I